MTKTYHFVPQYFLNPLHRITVSLIGAGGNGSQMLSALARIDTAVRSLGQKGLHVTVYDPDTVEAPNAGRQLFSLAEIGLNKADCLVTRFNRSYGLDWTSVPEKYVPAPDNLGNIIVTCVDNIGTRIDVGKAFRKADRPSGVPQPEHYAYYWLDLGNARRTGQAVLGSNRIAQPETGRRTAEYLPLATEVFDFRKIKEEDSGPSCSMAEALTRQDLFINSVLVSHAASLLWSLLNDVAIENRGFWLNLETCRVAPMEINENDIKLIKNIRKRRKKTEQ